ncbi:MAG: OsmC family protein [Geminicoccaceae bacterium]|nr:OsmC family protein [Geminicoccaceae bacterium]MCX8102131.1 OsmC family protein [Geminicoccaceae bacterium]MDW8370435.1 OsmC family protein [Geminicoccaceae bacterium]
MSEAAEVRVHPPHGTVVACESGRGTFALDVFAGRHRLTADEPVAAGGDDTGPNPYELLAAALAACTVMTLRMYARHKGLPVATIRCAVTHRKIHAEDCADCETRSGKIDRLERVIEIEGPLDATTRQRLLEIADRCPVHRTLEGEIRIETRLAGS